MLLRVQEEEKWRAQAKKKKEQKIDDQKEKKEEDGRDGKRREGWRERGSDKTLAAEILAVTVWESNPADALFAAVSFHKAVPQGSGLL